jgi:membrane-associated protease RseP (regulator of RpoE activity)
VNFPATIALFYNHGGVSIGSVSDSLPAHNSGLQAGDVLITINGTKVSSIADLRNYMSSVTPGQEIVVGTQRGNFPIKTGADTTNSSHALIGISGLADAYDPKMPFLSPDFPMIIFNAGFWLINVLISVAFINMLPMFPFDGDKFLEVILNALGIRRIKEIRMTANAAAYALLLLNVGLSFFRFGFLRY